ncbi:hypothetical protein INT48_009393 [Thamnidium elegans]|uniref:Uncharacterized protein n=1 Tax=Thamnidium elegans TaxID=101142 RepID=A0A8H7SLF7_9FUNG|nr:hypothetical protein INT48_009393 [Thamnidium elegans]
MDTHSNEEITTRQSSKLSLGSSPSVLSADEQLEAGSPGSLSNEEVSDDDLHTEQDSASPLSSVPDDFPLSRSASPELPMRRNKEDVSSPNKKTKSDKVQPAIEDQKDTSSDDLKKSLLDTPTEQNGDCEDTKMISEPQENDDHDYQQRHKEALDALTHIEVEFARLRDKMYEEKMSELNEEAMMIANGTHPELVTLMAEIEEKKGKRIHSAEAWRKHQHANFKQQFEGFEYQANIHFISQKNALRRDLLSSINGKRWNIEDERTKLNDPARTDRVFPDGREMVAHKREQKEETGELQDIKETAGFPMAPIPTGLSLQDVEDDLKILGINRNL